MPGIINYQIGVLREGIDAHNLVLAGVAAQQPGARLIDGPDEQVHAGQLGQGQHLLQLQGVGAGVVGEKLERPAGALQAVLGQAQAGVQVGHELVFALGLPARVVQLEGQQHGHVVAAFFGGCRAGPRGVAGPVEAEPGNQLVELRPVGLGVGAAGPEAFGISAAQGSVGGVAAQQALPGVAVGEADQVRGFHRLALGGQLVGGQRGQGFERRVVIALLERGLALQQQGVGQVGVGGVFGAQQVEQLLGLGPLPEAAGGHGGQVGRVGAAGKAGVRLGQGFEGRQGRGVLALVELGLGGAVAAGRVGGCLGPGGGGLGKRGGCRQACNQTTER